MDYISRDDVLRKFIEGDGHDDDRFTEGYNFAVQEQYEEAAAETELKSGERLEKLISYPNSEYEIAFRKKLSKDGEQND